MIKIAIVGSHGIGKTTLCNRLVEHLTSKQQKVGLVAESVRDCPLPIHKDQTIETTLWIVTKQINAELEAGIESPDYLVCDRAAIDPVIYHLANDPAGTQASLVEFVYDYSKTYDHIILIQPSNEPIQPDGFRSVDKMFQLSVHSLFVAWLAGKSKMYRQDEIFTNPDRIIRQILGEPDEDVSKD